MAPPTSTTLISPAELSYLRSSLALNPPIRPDARSPTQFRPLVAEIDILPSTNGSARMIWGDGGECVVGVKVEVEPTELTADGKRKNWVEIGVEVQGQRDDDPLGVFLGMTVTESLLTPSSTLTERLAITSRFHWKMYIDVCPPTLCLPRLNIYIFWIFTDWVLCADPVNNTTSFASRDTAIPFYKSRSSFNQTSATNFRGG